MMQRRRNSSSEEDESPVLKRSYSNFQYDESHDHAPTSSWEQPKIDFSTGQSGAFPGLADDNEIFYGPAANGIDYLRMVRSERKGIPQLLTSGLLHKDDGVETGGHYYDGAYTADPEQEVGMENTFGQAQRYYYDSLLAHFRLIRATMKCVPPLQKVQELDEMKPISFPAQSRPARRKWEQQLLEQSPHPVQMVCMDLDSVFQLAALMTRKMTHFFKSDNPERVESIGAWVWAILGKFPEQGELDGDEVAELRAFARRAIDVSNVLESKDLTAWDHQSDSDGSTDRVIDCLEDGVSLQQTSVLHRADEDLKRIEIRTRKLMILDAIVTVVGECYGQRDLLDLRTPWR